MVKPDEFWDKKVTHFCFWKEKDRLGFEVSKLCKKTEVVCYIFKSSILLVLFICQALDTKQCQSSD